MSSLCLLVTLSTPTLAEEQSEERVLLLRNGFVLTGKIVAAGDNFIVHFNGDSRARVPVGKVDSVHNNLESAYQHKRASLSVGDVAGRLKLAEWCLRHDLYARAADQVLAASAIDDSPRIDVLHRRLLGAAQPETTKPEQHVDEVPVAKAPPQTNLDNLPSGALEEFTSSVQPLLLNSCAGRGCHGPSTTSSFQLIRPHSRKLLTQRVTKRNLHATLGQVKRGGSSPLLERAVQTHGSQSEPAIESAESSQYELLAEWVRSLPPKSRSKSRTPRAATPRTETTFSPRRDFPGTQRRSPRSPSAGRDPFDPAPFNRRHHDDNAPARTANVSHR